MPTGALFNCLLLLCLALPGQLLAHDLDGIGHVHHPNGVVQIVDGEQASEAPNNAKSIPKETPKPAQPSGFASFAIQLVLILSALVLFFIALNAGARHRKRQTHDT